jgi:hypothetical protein
VKCDALEREARMAGTMTGDLNFQIVQGEALEMDAK